MDICFSNNFIMIMIMCIIIMCDEPGAKDGMILRIRSGAPDLHHQHIGTDE
jgi:hypothetical protein